MSIQCGWLRRSYWMVVVIHIIGSDKHIAMLSSAVIITHEPEIAACANRQLLVRDGQITRDEGKGVIMDVV